MTPFRNAATFSRTPVCDRQCWYFAGEAAGPEPRGDVFMSITSRSGSGKGTGFNRTASTMEKIAVLAPIPRVNAATAVKVKLGVWRNIRSECFTSFRKASILGLLTEFSPECLAYHAGQDPLRKWKKALGCTVSLAGGQSEWSRAQHRDHRILSLG